eukprot:c19569_g1_i4.p1 GENE.c19569_g1_i4~~c19569_g1_i4.p1  ORF type:complete len:233 (-),score=29.99 c19569_g1_i4:754-1452(-)
MDRQNRPQHHFQLLSTNGRQFDLLNPSQPNAPTIQTLSQSTTPEQPQLPNHSLPKQWFNLGRPVVVCDMNPNINCPSGPLKFDGGGLNSTTSSNEFTDQAADSTTPRPSGHDRGLVNVGTTNAFLSFDDGRNSQDTTTLRHLADPLALTQSRFLEIQGSSLPSTHSAHTTHTISFNSTTNNTPSMDCLPKGGRKRKFPISGALSHPLGFFCFSSFFRHNSFLIRLLFCCVLC